MIKPDLTYPPLNTLKPVANNVWIADGPVIRLGAPWPKIPFSTRMTVIRLPSGMLFVHSPTNLVASLKTEIEELGPPRFIVAPNRLHYWWLPEWRDAFGKAQMFAAPKVRKQAGDRIRFDCQTIDRESGYPWDGAIATLPISGSYMTEIAFFHRATRTLVLTDLIENFEAQKIKSPFIRFLTWAGGVQDPNGSTPRDLRATFTKRRPEFIAAVRRMIEWDPERIIIAHGRWYDRDGKAELIRAFRWLIDGSKSTATSST